MKSPEDIIEDVNFLRDYIKHDNQKGFESMFYDLSII